MQSTITYIDTYASAPVPPTSIIFNFGFQGHSRPPSSGLIRQFLIRQITIGVHISKQIAYHALTEPPKLITSTFHVHDLLSLSVIGVPLHFTTSTIKVGNATVLGCQMKYYKI